MDDSKADSSATGFHFPSAGIGCFVGLLLGIIVIGAIAGVILAYAAGGLYLGSLMSSGSGSVLHAVPSPNRSAIAYVLSDDCGATCDCSTRVDIALPDDFHHAAYRSEACDLEVVWLSDERLQVSEPEYTGSPPQVIDIDELGEE